MKKFPLKNTAVMISLLAAAGMLSGCKSIVLFPAGDIATRQADLLMASVWLMLIIIIPVMAMIVFFAWKYRESNQGARYEPDWDHSTKLELAIWAAPLLIIICLGAMTWVGTHLLDPYRPLARVSENKPLNGEKSLEINVVALDWKWLFLYPEQGVASVNELVVPTDRPVHFRITASSVMNAFYVPAMAGMIYAMPGMETKLHAVINKDGEYEGFSANYSGAGFSRMRFKARSVQDGDFDLWVSQARAAGNMLDGPAYLKLERPSENEAVRYYGRVESDLYPKIINMCVEPGKMCMGEMMAIDDRGGAGLAGLMLAERVTYDKNAPRGTSVMSTGYDFSALCAANPALELSRDPITRIPSSSPMVGHNLMIPISTRAVQ